MQPPQATDFMTTLMQQAELAVQIARDNYGITLDYTPASLPALNRLLAEAHTAYTSAGRNAPVPGRTIQVWGAYLGETLRRASDGLWSMNTVRGSDWPYYVTSPTGDEFPFEQVRLRVVNGYTDEQIEKAFAPRVKTQKKNNTALTCVLVGLGVSALCCLVTTVTLLVTFQTARSGQERALEAYKAAYEAPFINILPAYMADYPPSMDDLPLISGRMLIVDMQSRGIADLHYDLPEELRANSPADVSVVVQQSCRTDVSPRTCRLTLVDPHTRQTLMWQDFVDGGMPGAAPLNLDGMPLDEAGGALHTSMMIYWLEMWVE